MHPIQRTLILITIAATVVGVSACNPQAKGFALPPGDATRGQQTFIALGCNSCHSVRDKLERDLVSADPSVNVALGGEVTRVKTYGDLVTSIINPSHKLSRGNDPSTVMPDGTSVMQDYNDVMTVQQLLDLTSFLQESYTVWVPEYGPYYFP